MANLSVLQVVLVVSGGGQAHAPDKLLHSGLAGKGAGLGASQDNTQPVVTGDRQYQTIHKFAEQAGQLEFAACFDTLLLLSDNPDFVLSLHAFCHHQ